MASQALYRKWRSQTFDEIIGQPHVTTTLVNALRLGRVAHAYLFCGPRGTGKTSTARLLAKAVNCLAEEVSDRPCNQCPICVAVNEARLMDLIEIDAASNTGVDDIRDLRDKVSFRPAEARIKFYIIDEVHMLSNSAFNALLKTLEEPPGHVIFVLATTEPEKIPATITSRCQRFDFKRIKLNDMVQRLAHIVSEEGFEADQTALAYIARQGAGSMRDAISLLDQMVAYGGATITLELVQSVLGLGESQSVIELVDALIDQDVALGLDIINQVVNDGIDPRQFAREVVEHLRAVMLVKLGKGVGVSNFTEETLVAVKSQASRIDTALVVNATTRFNAAVAEIRSSLLAMPQLPLELAFVETVISTQTEPASIIQTATQTEPIAPRVSTSRPPTSVSSGVATVSPHKTPPSEPPPTSPVIDGDEEVTVEAVQSCFEQALQDLEEGRTKDGRRGTLIAKALRNAAQLNRVSGNEIHFVTSNIMKEKFEKPQPRANIDDVFSRLLGRPVRVRFWSDRELPISPSPASSNASATHDGPKNQPVDEETNTLLKVATEELGGKIVES
jgi:DNA polymerase-3 subunit gamma/tau